MNTPPPRQVTLRIRAPRSSPEPTLRADLDAHAMAAIMRRSEELGIASGGDPAIRALLSAAKLHDDVPPLLYTAFAAVLSRITAAADTCSAMDRSTDE